MKISIVAQHDPNMFTALLQLARVLSDHGNDISFMSTIIPVDHEFSREQIYLLYIDKPTRLGIKISIIRSNFYSVYNLLVHTRPDFVIGEHEYIIPSVMYKLSTFRNVKIAAYSSDFQSERRYVTAMKPFASAIDAYIDVCDLRVGWQRELWPRMKAASFVVRNAPWRQPDAPLEPHEGAPRMVLTGSAPMMLHATNPARFARFVTRLCGHGISLDWYLMADEAARDAARALSSHPLYRVRDPLPKSRLLPELRTYDVGLFWAPMADGDLSRARGRSIFISAASNKIAEYIGAGLAVAHTGNPGLSYLPPEICAPFDATNPEAGADQLAAALADREGIERRRQAALRYHQHEMNFEDQVAPLVDFFLKNGSGTSGIRPER